MKRRNVMGAAVPLGFASGHAFALARPGLEILPTLLAQADEIIE